MANRLSSEISPYLQQHAHNPVDWYPWGPEALERSRRENRPILLSIGYSACHWCHVMEHESFDDPAIAETMNAAFVNIKVDREERPDLDKIYQTALQVMTRRSGGWPLTVFLTPNLEPFYAGTYFPPEPRHGSPSFAMVLESVAQAFADKPDEVSSMAGEVVEALRSLDAAPDPAGVSPEIAIGAAQTLALRFDERYGGFGDAPKFPNTMSHDVMLRAHRRSGDDRWLSIVEQSAQAMLEGGIHDQLGGGFHRYSTDARWRVPHFEKMLYDNALLARLFVDLWRMTRRPIYRETCEALLEYVVREMTAAEGGFYATQDADSEGHEGTFFVWTPEQLQQALAHDDAKLAALYWGVDEAGNFENGTTVLHRTRSIQALAEQTGGSLEETTSRLNEIREKLFAFRELRPKPFRDEKIIASWNGLMAGAFAEAGAAFNEPRWVDRARRALGHLRAEFWRAPHLARIAKDGVTRGRGFLIDYAAVANAALDLYEATFEGEWADWAQALADAALDAFWDESEAQLSFARPSEDLIVRNEDNLDGELPSGSSSMLQLLLRLDALGCVGPYRAVADRVLARRAAQAASMPFAYGHLVGVVDHWIRGASHVLFVGGGGSADRTNELVRQARTTFVLDRMLTGAKHGEVVAESLLGAVPTTPGAYVCRDRTCTPPIVDAEALRAVLERS